MQRQCMYDSCLNSGYGSGIAWLRNGLSEWRRRRKATLTFPQVTRVFALLVACILVLCACGV